jgi:cystathionine beta-lyase/cystathionine gamma-synthase
LADLDDEDLYISENENSIPDNVEVDPNEKMEGEVSDDEAYIIPKPLTDMEKRRQQIKRNAEKK